jgi:uroporphyrinogen decarboxylase
VEANALGRYTVFPREESATVVIKGSFSQDDLAAAQDIKISFDTRLLGYVEMLKLMSIGLTSSVMRGAYVTGPYSLAGLLLGADEAATATAMRPEELAAVCLFATEKILEYVRLLIAAGAQVICVLEPTAVMLGPDQFEEFSARYVRAITDSCRYAGVATVYHTCGNTMHIIKKMGESGVDGVSIDSREVGVDIAKAAALVPPEVMVIGNLSPTGTILNGRPADVEQEVTDLLRHMDPYPNFILSTGCDLPQETPLENIHAFMRAGRRYKIKH